MAEEPTVFLPRRATTRLFVLVGAGCVVVFAPMFAWAALTPSPAQLVAVPFLGALALLGAWLWARGAATQRNCRLALTPRGFEYVSPWGRHRRVSAASVHRMRIVVAGTQGPSAFVAGGGAADAALHVLAAGGEQVARLRGHARPATQALEAVLWTDEGRVSLPLESLDPALADRLVPALLARGMPRERLEVRRSRKRVIRT